jgi:hypothetical protein
VGDQSVAGEETETRFMSADTSADMKVDAQPQAQGVVASKAVDRGPARDESTPVKIAVERLDGISGRLGAWFQRKSSYYGILSLAVVGIFGLYYQRWPLTPQFETPTAYSETPGAVTTLAFIKAFSDVPPPWNIHIARLNAPWGADWNDVAIPEKLIYYFAGVAARVFSLGTTANLALLMAHWTAALGFAWSARRLGRRPLVAMLGGLLWAFAPPFVSRGLPQLSTLFAWHVPVLLYFAFATAEMKTLPSAAMRWTVAMVMLATAWQSPYYLALALQLFAITAARCWFRGFRGGTRLSLEALAVGLFGSWLGQLNVSLNDAAQGSNLSANRTDLGNLVTSGLRLPDLFFPLNYPIRFVETFARTHYFEAGNPPSDNAGAFLGFAWGLLLAVLASVCIVQGLRGRFRDIEWEGWALGYVLILATVGGLEYVFTTLGFGRLYATNRYSVVILCIVLLWACRRLEQLASTLRQRALLVVVTAVAVFECIGTRRPNRDATIERTASSDRQFAEAVERRLPRGAGVFQLGADTGAPPKGEFVGGEDGFRLFLWTEQLRFATGAQVGRPREDWQARATTLSPSAFLQELRHHDLVSMAAHILGLTADLRALERECLKKGDIIATSLNEEWDACEFRDTNSSLATHIAFRFFPQGASSEPYTVANAQLVDPGGWVGNVARTFQGAYSVTLRVPVKRVWSIQVTSQNVSAPDSFARLYDVLYEGAPSLFAFRINNVESGAVVDMPPNAHDSIMVSMDVELQ